MKQLSRGRMASAVLIMATAMTTSVAHGQPLQALDAIQGAAEAFVRAQLPQTGDKYFLSATRLDERLRLTQCAAALEAFLQTPGTLAARTTVGVHCPTQNPWTVYVQVSLEEE